MGDSKISVCAVVVTYNRKSFLADCLNALLKQTVSVDSIIIIDNASVDQTQDFLREKGYLANQKIDYVRLMENTGGAGGFYKGIKRGYEKGFDWLWLIDDDSFPDTNTLELFLSFAPDRNCCYGPLVVDPQNKNKLSFGCYGFNGRKKIFFKTVDEVRHFAQSTNSKIIDGFANFYNGIFISKEIIKDVGLPRREMFICGDENEYLFRILSKGFKIQIMLNVFFFHPFVQNSLALSLFGKDVQFIDSAAKWKYYYTVRNELYITAKYGRQLGVRMPFLKSFISSLIVGMRIKRLRKFVFWGLFDQFLGRTYRKPQGL